MNKTVKNGCCAAVILAVTLGACLLLQNVVDMQEHVATFFVFAAFLVSLVTEGYLWGLLASVAGVLAVNFVFTFPYFAFNFSIWENLVSAIVMIVVSVLTSALTTRLKKWEQIKKEGELEKMRSNLLRAVSHDLRTPLTTIYGAGSMLLEHGEELSEPQKQELLRGICQDAQWLTSMVENLLSVTRLEGGALALHKTPTVVEELLDSVYQKFHKRYPEQNVTFSLPDEVVIVPMDPMLMEQVLVNLLENSVQHARGMEHLHLGLYTENGQAVIEIEDDGAGIPKDRLSRLFQGTFAPSAEQKGNAGIGLTVCAAIVKAHGGTITGENRREGGARFTVRLDLEDSDGQQ